MRLQAIEKGSVLRRDAQVAVAPTSEAEGGGTLAAAICRRVRADIVSGARKPGTRVRLEDLKSAFDVSWSPIREALSRLVAEGLIVAEGRGYCVAPVSKAQFEEVIRLRTLLESMALRGAIERGDEAWEAEVLAAHHRLSKLEVRRWNAPDDAEQWERWHRTYHAALINACGSPILLQFCDQLNDMTDRYRRLFLSTHRLDRDVAGEHRAITDATVGRDANRACRLLERHIQRTGRNILSSMNL